jgi:hypothetical protein
LFAPLSGKEISMIIKQYVKSRKVAKITFELAKDELPADVKAESVYLVGEFNDWDTTATPMKRNKKGAYRATIDLKPGQSYQFRYLVNDKNWYNDWNADSYVPGNFGEDNCVVITPNINNLQG